MVSQLVLDGNWHELSDKLKAKWDQLSDDDLRASPGNVEQLVGPGTDVELPRTRHDLQFDQLKFFGAASRLWRPSQ